MSKINENQKEALISFMEVKYLALFGKFSNLQGKKAKDDMWQQLVKELNELGPPVKDVEKWKRVSKTLI